MKILTQPVTVQHKMNCDKKFENNKPNSNKRHDTPNTNIEERLRLNLEADEKTSPFPFCFGRRQKKEKVCK